MDGQRPEVNKPSLEMDNQSLEINQQPTEMDNQRRLSISETRLFKTNNQLTM